MTKRKRKKRINFELSDEHWLAIHEIAKDLNITIKKYIWRLVLPDVEKRMKIKGEK